MIKKDRLLVDNAPSHEIYVIYYNVKIRLPLLIALLMSATAWHKLQLSLGEFFLLEQAAFFK